MEVRDWCEFFTVYRTVSDGSNKKFASGIKRYIFSFYSRDKKFIKVNVKPTFYCSLLQVMSVNTCLIYRCLSSASAVIRSWFIYELQKSTTIAFSRNLLYTFYSRNPTCGIPPYLRISNRKYPAMPSEFHNRESPLPFGNPKSRPWYGMDIFWNRPLLCVLNYLK